MFKTALNIAIIGRRGSGKEMFVSDMVYSFKDTMKLEYAIACSEKKTPESFNGVPDVVETDAKTLAEAVISCQTKLQEKGENPRLAVIFDQTTEWYNKKNAPAVLALLRIANRLNVVVLLCLTDAKQIPEAFLPFIDVACFAKDDFLESVKRGFKKFGSSYDLPTFVTELHGLNRFEFLCVDQRAAAVDRSTRIIAVKRNAEWCSYKDSTDYGNWSKKDKDETMTEKGKEGNEGKEKKEKTEFYEPCSTILAMLGLDDA